jgi:hypothetical protein
MFGSKFDLLLLSNSFPYLRSFPSFAFFKSVLQVSGIPMMFGSKFDLLLLSNSFPCLRSFPSFAFFKSVVQASGIPMMSGSKFDLSLLQFPMLEEFSKFCVLQISSTSFWNSNDVWFKFDSSLLSNSFPCLRSFLSFAFFKSVLQASGLSCSLLPCIKSGYL